MPKSIKDSVDLPDFVKESVAQIQILCIFQADFRDVTFGSRCGVWALSSSLIFSPSLNDLPEKCTKSECFAGFSRHV